MKLKVSSKPERFRRAGVAFTKEPQEIDVDQKTCDILKRDPMLVVEEVQNPPQSPFDKGGSEGGGLKKGKGK